jgi:hypothetical protein
MVDLPKFHVLMNTEQTQFRRVSKFRYLYYNKILQAGDVAQVAECMSRKPMAVSSNPHTK